MNDCGAGIESAQTARTLDRIYRALAERGCDPEWTHDGRGIIATCPCCDGRRALVVESANATRAEA